ncbi:MAG TPA: magnesium/cobalt transporter CorA [Actinomycetota bacterium]|nr:magnesium/cobalt transporter CorA [Actinomycetota bacterium]
MITCRVYRDGALQDEIPFGEDAVQRALASEERIWVDVVDPTAEELLTLQMALGLHELAVEDSLRWGQRSKVDFYQSHVFLVAHGLRLDEADELVDSEVHVFAGPGRYVVTVRREPVFGFAKAIGRVRAEAHLGSEGIGLILYLLLDEIVDGYLDAVERLEDVSDEIEEAVSAEDIETDPESSRALATRMFELRQTVVRFRRLAAPLREATNLLLETPTLATPPLVPYYRDVLDHVIRALELTDNVRDLLTSARELQLAQVSNRLNVVMKQLTAWAAIILIPTLIAGIYGMNFTHMPELDWRLGYPMALGLMGGSALVLYRVFRRRDWL